MIAVVSLLAWLKGSQWIMFAMLGGFVFLAPLTCIGLYAISAQLERGQAPLLSRSLRAAFRRHLGNEMIFAIVLLVIFLVWARAAVMVTVFGSRLACTSQRALPMVRHTGIRKTLL